jgi:DNA-binding HxlR family transcriptional regulator
MTSRSLSVLGRPVRGSQSGRPIMALLDILGQRWTLRILWELRDGAVGFRDLAARADSMSQSVLNRRLKELEAACLVTSDDKGWRLSDEGTRLLGLLSPLSDFARKWAALVARGDESGGSHILPADIV